MLKNINTKKLLSIVNILLFVVFVVFCLYIKQYHEPWRDEAQSWLIARDSSSISNLFQITRYEGSPALWQLILYIIIKLGGNYNSMFNLHALIILAISALIIFKSKFNFFIKVLLLTSYFFLFEYNVVARSYSLSVLFIFLIAGFYENLKNHKVIFYLLLGLLANTNIHSLMISIIIFIFSSSKLLNAESWKDTFKKIFSFYYLIYFALIIISIFQLIPPYDISKTLSSISYIFDINSYSNFPFFLFSSFIPLPLGGITGVALSLVTILGLIILIISIMFIYLKNKNFFYPYIFGIGTLILFFLFINFGTSRNHGLIFIIFIYYYWLIKSQGKTTSQIDYYIYKRINLRIIVEILLIIFLILNSLAGVIAVKNEYNEVFSEGKNVAEYLISNNYASEENLIISYPSYIGTSVLPYLDKYRHTFYFLEYEQEKSFTVWNTTYDNSLRFTKDIIKSKINNIIKNNPNRNILVLISNSSLQNIDTDSWVKLETFSPSIVEDESYILYKIK